MSFCMTNGFVTFRIDWKFTSSLHGAVRFLRNQSSPSICARWRLILPGKMKGRMVNRRTEHRFLCADIVRVS
jgi:hypothetical protein